MNSQDPLPTKKNVTCILHSKVAGEPAGNPGNLMQAFFQSENEKQGKWLSPRSDFFTDSRAETVSIASSKGFIITAAAKYVSHAIFDDFFASKVLESVGEIDATIWELADDSRSEASKEPEHPLDHNSDDLIINEWISFVIGDRLEALLTLDR